MPSLRHRFLSRNLSLPPHWRSLSASVRAMTVVLPSLHSLGLRRLSRRLRSPLGLSLPLLRQLRRLRQRRRSLLKTGRLQLLPSQRCRPLVALVSSKINSQPAAQLRPSRSQRCRHSLAPARLTRRSRRALPQCPRKRSPRCLALQDLARLNLKQTRRRLPPLLGSAGAPKPRSQPLAVSGRSVRPPSVLLHLAPVRLRIRNRSPRCPQYHRKRRRTRRRNSPLSLSLATKPKAHFSASSPHSRLSLPPLPPKVDQASPLVHLSPLRLRPPTVRKRRPRHHRLPLQGQESLLRRPPALLPSRKRQRIRLQRKPRA